MLSRRFLPIVAASSMLLALVGCGGTTPFNVGPMAVAGTPPPPPPPPPPAPPPPKEEPKPPPRVELRDNKIEFKEKIQFEVNKSVIKEESFSLLHDIAEVIKQNPHVKKISIEGHASAEGDAAKNKKLSDDRSKSVMKHLVDKESVEASRMVAKGWGVEKPIADNSTEEGREKNRRVEFLVVEQDITKKKVEIDPKTGKEKVLHEKTESHKPDEAPAPAGTDTAKPDAKKKPGEKPAAGEKPAGGDKPDAKKPAGGKDGGT
jgi:outer membrane protein OmpA-like peptidoglycan-associated protein